MCADGIFIYKTVPGVGDAAYAVLPLVNAFQSIPFAGLILFFTLSYFARSSNLSRFVRFNIQQAILLDIVLIVPGFFDGAELKGSKIKVTMAEKQVAPEGGDADRGGGADCEPGV